MKMKNFKTYLVILIVVGLVAVVAAQINIKKLKPSEMGEKEDGTKFRTPVFKARKLPKPVPLEVKKFEVQILANGTSFGRPGDVLITFFGQGFLDTSLPIRVIFSKDIVLKNNYLNDEQNELYVVVPAEVVESSLKKTEFKEVIIENPGGTVKMKFKRTSVKMLPKDILEIDPKEKKARLLATKYFVKRQAVEEEEKR